MPVIDTIKGVQLHKLFPQYQHWTQTRHVRCGKDRLALKCSNGLILGFKCSLPKIAFGNNHTLIKDQLHVNRLLIQIKDTLSLYGIPMEQLHFTRVDACWQFDIDPNRAFAAFRHLRHPRARLFNEYEKSGKTGIFWKGKYRRLRVYADRQGEIRRSRGITRFELELHGEALDQAQLRDRLLIAKAYAAFREAFLGFNTAPAGTAIKVKDEALIYAERQTGNILPLLRQCLSDYQVKQFQRKLARTVLDHELYDLPKLLPVNCLPIAVEPFPKDRARIRLLTP